MSADQVALFLAGDRTAFSPGETLEVSALWALDKAPQTFELRLFWQTQGKGTEDVEVVERQRIENPGTAGERIFQLRLPVSPYSFSGRLISLVWALELVGEPDGPVARRELVVAPGGQELVLRPESTDDAPGA